MNSDTHDCKTVICIVIFLFNICLYSNFNINFVILPDELCVNTCLNPFISLYLDMFCMFLSSVIISVVVVRSFCRKHRPTQTCSSTPTLPLSCSICLEPIEPVLSYSVLKCPACHGSWFHRDCVQVNLPQYLNSQTFHAYSSTAEDLKFSVPKIIYISQNQAHSAALYFFRCTLCNNSDQFQQEMLRMGIHIPERYTVSLFGKI